MDGREFLGVAQDDAAGPSEAHWRSGVVNAYYALMLEGRDALLRWGFTIPPRQNVHAWIRLSCIYAADTDLKNIGYALENLVRLRTLAHYHLKPAPAFTSGAKAQE